MIKVSVFLTRRSDLTHEQFSSYWKEKHTTLLLSLQSFTDTVRSYKQQHVSQDASNLPTLSFDGVAETWFDSREIMLRAFAAPEYLEVVAKDEENFLDRSKTMFLISEEITIV